MPDAGTLGKWIVVLGLGLVALGGLVWVVGRLGLPLGRLPGDINIRGDNFSLYFPCATAIIASIVLTVLLNLAARFLRR
ncbi:MAG: DUF2905 domain-containing protein [Anaerolineales bacterium]|nr:DUF2905 domain-containing protein [Anaerolineales bacterium]